MLLPPPPSSLSSLSLGASFPDNTRVSFWMPRGCTSALAFKKITEHAVGQMPVGVACLCWWFIKSNPSRILGSQGAEGREKASNLTPAHLPTPPAFRIHISCLQVPFIHSSRVGESILSGRKLANEVCGESALFLGSIQVVYQLLHGSKSRVGVVSPVIGAQWENSVLIEGWSVLAALDYLW